MATVTLLTGHGRVTAAKNIRIELKAAFPGIKFSVTSETFAGGDAIDVRWTDGPTTAKVNAIIDKYSHGDFDGMTDSYNYNRGEARAWTDAHGGAKYVNSSRKLSPDLVQRGIDAVVAKYGDKDKPTVDQFQNGHCWNTSPFEGEHRGCNNGWSDLIHRAIAEIDG